jgi:hypothetical protein
MTLEQLNDQKVIGSKIIETIIFFDLFDYPLTALEVWRNLYYKVPVTEQQVEDILKSEGLSHKIAHQADYYFLIGRAELIKMREARHAFASTKFKRAKRMAYLFKFIPWIKMIAVSNLIGSYNLRESSDIDLFIVVQENRIWLTRFFTVLVTKLLGLRPKPNKTQDTICLSFFVSEQALSLKNFLLFDDIYFTYWLAGLELIYEMDSTFVKVYQANSWLLEFLPNWVVGSKQFEFKAGQAWPKSYRLIVDFLFGWMENIFKKLQFKMLAPELKQLMNLDNRVVINDQVLKLHSNDRREEFSQRFKSRIKNYE